MLLGCSWFCPVGLNSLLSAFPLYRVDKQSNLRPLSIYMLQVQSNYINLRLKLFATNWYLRTLLHKLVSSNCTSCCFISNFSILILFSFHCAHTAHRIRTKRKETLQTSYFIRYGLTYTRYHNADSIKSRAEVFGYSI